MRALWHPREAGVGDMHAARERPPFKPSYKRPHVPRREGGHEREAVHFQLLEVREPAHERREPVVREARDAAHAECGERGRVRRDRLQAEVGELGAAGDVEVGEPGRVLGEQDQRARGEERSGIPLRYAAEMCGQYGSTAASSSSVYAGGTAGSGSGWKTRCSA